MKKDCKIELYRFFAALFIIMGHYYAYIQPGKVWPFSVSYQFVEFFFITTGYFTAKHFSQNSYKDTSIRDILMYDVRKFVRFIPYTIPAILFVYFLELVAKVKDHVDINWLITVKDFLLEVFFLSTLNQTGAHLFVMWFLSAMFITLPFIIVFCLFPNKLCKIVAGVCVGCSFFFLKSDYTLQIFPDQLFRAFFGMLIGTVIFYLGDWIKGHSCPSWLKWGGTIVFVVAYGYPILYAYKNYFILKEDLVCFVIWIFLVMADLTVLPVWHHRGIEFLGKLSMPIFIWHIPVIELMLELPYIENEVIRLLVCYGLTFVVAGVNMWLVKHFSREDTLTS